MPATFLAPIFQNAAGTGLSASGRAAAGYLFRTIGDQAVRMAVDAGIGLVVDTAEDAIALTAQQIEDLAAETLVQFLGISCPGINEDEVVINEAATQRILNGLGEKDRGDTVLADFFNELNEGFQFAIEVATGVANISEVAGCALGVLRAENDLLATRKFPDDSGAPRRVRQCNRTSTDGQRVSREAHEWEYCRQSQFGDVLNEARQWGQRVLDDDAENGGVESGVLPAGLTLEDIRDMIENEERSFAVRDYTYGNFVDMAETRKGIEQLRRANRAVTGPGFTQLFNLLDVSRDETIAQINDAYDWGLVLREILRMNVQQDSLQDGAFGGN